MFSLLSLQYASCGIAVFSLVHTCCVYELNASQNLFMTHEYVIKRQKFCTFTSTLVAVVYNDGGELR